jgi:hypothetical protein
VADAEADTSVHREVVAERVPDVPVTVMLYVPVVVVDVVVAVSVVVTGVVALVIETEAGETLQVVGLTAPEGALETVQATFTVPVKEFAGVTVMVAVLPEVAPGATVRLPLLEREKLVLVVLVEFGFTQNPAHPVTKGAANSNTCVHFPNFMLQPHSSNQQYARMAKTNQITVSGAHFRRAGYHPVVLDGVDAGRRESARRRIEKTSRAYFSTSTPRQKAT